MAKKKANKKTKKGVLDADQKKFINSKVKELGTIEAVEKFYNRDDTVTEFARDVAKKLYASKKKVKK